MSLSVVDVLVNGIWGGGIAIERICDTGSLHKRKCRQRSSMLEKSTHRFCFDSLVVALEDPLCLYKHLTGNLGSSLAKLMQMTDQISGYNVPDGLVITTAGYEEYFSSVVESILILKENISKYDTDQLMLLCERIVEEVSNSHFPPELHDSLYEKLNEFIGDLGNVSFTIYPSMTGSCTEVQLLEAYLDKFTDVVGLSDVIKCIKKCWASQFNFGAINCKRSTGQSLNIPTAVIVQKTVPFKTSGVISTCDSSGNPSIMEIREEIDKIRI